MSETARPSPAIPRHPFAELLGVTTEAGPDGLPICRLVVGPRHHNPVGVVHGGAAFTLVDTVMGCVVHMVHNPEGQAFVSTDVHIRYLRPVTDGELIASARIEASTRNTRTLSGTVRRPDGAVVAFTTARYQRIEPR